MYEYREIVVVMSINGMNHAERTELDGDLARGADFVIVEYSGPEYPDWLVTICYRVTTTAAPTWKLIYVQKSLQ